MSAPRERFQPTISYACGGTRRTYVTVRSLLFLALFLAIVPTAQASSKWYVDGVNGSDNNNCKSQQKACKTIQRAISRASSGDSIIIAPAIYLENLAIKISLKLLGSGASTTIIDGQAHGNVIYLSKLVDVTMTKLTIRNGSAARGGGINITDGSLTVTDCVISRNRATANEDASGAGVYNYQGMVIIDNSTISDNHNTGNIFGWGGGILNLATMTISNSTISGNSASVSGGGIQNEGTLTITNSTISGNEARFEGSGGGGIINEGGTVTLNNVTISKNRTQGLGGGIDNDIGTAILRNSIVANNSRGGNCRASLISKGYNLSSDNTCNFSSRGDLNNTDPKLGRLRNNGGPTQTHALLPGSPAIDAGNPKGCRDDHGHLLKTDQRGKPRPDKEDKSGCDMGAYERQRD